MEKIYYTWSLAMWAMMFTSCIHDYPTHTVDGTKGIDPTLVKVNTSMTLNLVFLPLKTEEVPDSRTGKNYRHRFIVEVSRQGEVKERQVILTEEKSKKEGEITLSVSLKLHAVEYTLAVWSDYVKAGDSTDLYYNTTDLQSVICTSPYIGSNSLRDCLYATTLLDLRPYRDEWNANVQVALNLERPLAGYRVIATDAKEFIRRMKLLGGAEGMTITFKYGFFVPTGFNVVTEMPINSVAGVMFTTPLVLSSNGAAECELGYDFLFVNEVESFVLLTTEVHNAEGELISRTNNLKIPYKRGHQTTIRTKLLTDEMGGGMEIDPDFEGYLEFDLDKIM